MIEADRAFKVRNSRDHFVLLALDTLQDRLKTLQMLEQKIFDILGHNSNLRCIPYFRDNFLRGIAKVICSHDRKTRIGKYRFAFGDIRPLKPDD